MCKLLLTNLLEVAIISTVDESINSRYSRGLEKAQAGAGAMKKSAGELSVDDISSDVIIQQKLQWNRISRELLPAVGIWSYGLALMTSSVTSSYSADDLSEQSQESADSAGRLCVYFSSRSYSGSSRNAKISSRSVCSSSRKKINLLVLKKIQAKQLNQTQATAARNPGAKNCRSSKAQQLKKESAAKQLTTDEKLSKAGCQLLSVIQMVKTTRSLQKKRTQSVTQLRLFVHLRSLGVLTVAGCGIGSVHAVVRSNLLVEPSEVEEGEIRKQQQHPVESYNISAVATHPVARNPGAKNCRSSKAQQLKKESAAKQLTTYEELSKAGCQLLSVIQMAKMTRSLQKKRTQSVTQLRLFVHLRSLGVLTAAGCGIGSVYAVVRSNLLVEPSEVEEGEM
ncbi:pentatricopeptide repeat-containing protein chloroplastic-like [Dorcoceras hygrometricum]|uniref:Pentatricopeptide repeat-containing protein chloroplastic-like n=1 Tax=Dorcoceras hygrometricum TaxID=472368 RepID=A0A2Z7ATY1_9LAMI|nr:pentatricopeptide repeat-containing protein chloroplastic-like [Dorcoceras hygrometricum]